MAKNNFTTIKHILYFTMFIILSSFTDLFSFNTNNDNFALISTIVVSIPILLFIFHKYTGQLKKYNPKNFGLYKLSIKFLLFTIAAFLTITIINIAISYFINIDSSNNQQLIEDYFYFLPKTTFLSTVIFAPILEELIYRGIFFNYFFNEDSKFCNFLTVLISGLVFGFVHVFNISLDLLIYSLIGWFLGIVYMYTKNLKYSILFHFMQNFLSTILLFSI